MAVNRMVLVLLALTMIDTNAKRITRDRRKLQGDADSIRSMGNTTQVSAFEEEVQDDEAKAEVRPSKSNLNNAVNTQESVENNASKPPPKGQNVPFLTFGQISSHGMVANLRELNVEFKTGSMSDMSVALKHIGIGAADEYTNIEWTVPRTHPTTDSALNYVIRLESHEPKSNPEWAKPRDCHKDLPSSGSFFTTHRNVLCVQDPGEASPSDPCLYTIWRSKVGGLKYFLFKTTDDGKSKEMVAQAECGKIEGNNDAWFLSKADKNSSTGIMSKRNRPIFPQCTFYASSCPGKENSDKVIGQYEYDKESRKQSLTMQTKQTAAKQLLAVDHPVGMYLTFISSLVKFGWVTLDYDSQMRQAKEDAELLGKKKLEEPDVTIRHDGAMIDPHWLGNHKAGTVGIITCDLNSKTGAMLSKDVVLHGWTTSNVYWKERTMSQAESAREPCRYPFSYFDAQQAAQIPWVIPAECGKSAKAPTIKYAICIGQNVDIGDADADICPFVLVSSKPGVWFLLIRSGESFEMGRYVYWSQSASSVHFQRAHCPVEKSKAHPLGYKEFDTETLMAEFVPENSGNLLTVFKPTQGEDVKLYITISTALRHLKVNGKELVQPSKSDASASLYTGLDFTASLAQYSQVLAPMQ